MTGLLCLLYMLCFKMNAENGFLFKTVPLRATVPLSSPSTVLLRTEHALR